MGSFTLLQLSCLPKQKVRSIVQHSGAQLSQMPFTKIFSICTVQVVVKINLLIAMIFLLHATARFTLGIL